MREDLQSRMRTKSFRIAALIFGIALLLLMGLAGPATAESRRLLVMGLSGPATATPRTLLVTLVGGKQVTLTVDAAPGTPVGSIPLPDLGATPGTGTAASLGFTSS